MKKNERLFDIMGDVSPEYVAEATETKKRARGGISISRKKLFALIAAVVTLAALSCAMFLPGSAVVPNEGDVEYYEFGTVLSEVPDILLAEDYQALIAMMDAKIAKHPEMARTYDRFKAFYSLQSPREQKSPFAKEKLMEIYPITKLADIYTLDRNSTMLEDEFILYLLMYYGEMSQEDLIDAYTKMYDLVDASTLSEEEKEHIRQSLPEIPVIDENDPSSHWVIGEKVEGCELRFPSSALPGFLTKEGYEQLCAMVNGDKATGFHDEAQNLFLLDDIYIKLPAWPYSSRDQELFVEESAAINGHMQSVMDVMKQNGYEVYVLNPYATLHQKTMATYYISQETEITQEQLRALTNEFFNTLNSLPLSEKEIDKLKKTCYSLHQTLAP